MLTDLHSIHKLAAIIGIALLPATLTNVASAATATWSGEGKHAFWDIAENWSRNTPPQSEFDSVLITNSNTPALNHPFTIGSGQSMIAAENTNGVLRIDNGGHLTVATGGTLDFSSKSAYGIAEGGGIMRLTFEPGAAITSCIVSTTAWIRITPLTSSQIEKAYPPSPSAMASSSEAVDSL